MGKLGYQKIDFDGYHLEGINRYPEYRAIFPNPPVGKTILDLGCYVGYYIFQSSRDGAKYCMGIDWNEERINKAEEIKDFLGIQNVNFFMGNAVISDIQNPFDIVLCLSVLHHVRHGKEIFLEKLGAWAKEKIIFICGAEHFPLIEKRWKCEIEDTKTRYREQRYIVKCQK